MADAFNNIGSFSGDGNGLQARAGSGLQTVTGLGSNSGDIQNFSNPLGTTFTSDSSAGAPPGSPFDPSESRLSQSGLRSSARDVPPGVTWLDGRGQQSASASGVPTEDWRVRASVGINSKILYRDENNTLLKPIRDTGGVVFPITPQIQLTHTAKYNAQSLTHSNYAMHFYEGSEVGSIQINGDFPVQTVEEGQYLLAAVYFFRAATKMFWGNDRNAEAGTPPPMLFLSGYGTHYFPNVPCVLTQFMHTMPHDGDFIEVPTPGKPNGSITRMPTLSTLQCQFQPIYSRASLREFTLKEFANGGMLKGGFI